MIGGARGRTAGALSVTVSLILGLLLAQTALRGAPQTAPLDLRPAAPPPLPALAPVVLPPPPALPEAKAMDPAPSDGGAPAKIEPAAQDSPLPIEAEVEISEKTVDTEAQAPEETERREAEQATVAPTLNIKSRQSQSVAEGRALLRMLETGKGPSIEIAWPDAPSQRDSLFQAFQACLGLQVALLTPDNRLFTMQAPSGQATRPQADRMSRFLRRPSGAVPGPEHRIHGEIRRKHGLTDAVPVRLLPRNVDAALLGGLFGLAGPAYRPGSVIHARYRLESDSLAVEDIRIDGKPTAGRLRLSLSLLRRCDP